MKCVSHKMSIWSKLASRRFLQLIFVVVPVLSSGACSRDSDVGGVSSQSGSVAVSEARVTVPPKGRKNAVVYMVLRSSLPHDVQIVHLSTPAAGSAEVHRHIYENGMHKMRPVAHARVPAGGELRFEPGGYHIMLLDLVETLQEGNSIPVVFELDNGVKVVANVEVIPRG